MAIEGSTEETVHTRDKGMFLCLECDAGEQVRSEAPSLDGLFHSDTNACLALYNQLEIPAYSAHQKACHHTFWGKSKKLRAGKPGKPSDVAIILQRRLMQHHPARCVPRDVPSSCTGATYRGSKASLWQYHPARHVPRDLLSSCTGASCVIILLDTWLEMWECGYHPAKAPYADGSTNRNICWINLPACILRGPNMQGTTPRACNIAAQ
eukprot:889442-Pelagomonas_calceolata.AAC.1